MLARGARFHASQDMIEIRVPARIHAGLIELSGTGYRTNGGVGWALEAPELVITACLAKRISIEDRRRAPLQKGELAEITCELEEIATGEGLGGARICIEGALLAHRGLGGGTAVRLAAIECLMSLAGRVAVAPDLVRLSRRGGTSGVGIRTYFDGGLAFDLGHAGPARAQPSRDRAGSGAPLALLSLDMPCWPMGLLSCDWLPAIGIEKERRLFAETTPSPADVHDILYHMTFGLVAAARECDPDTFATAIDTIQLGAWKRAEWACHGSELQDVARALRAAGARGVGLSSVGPALFFLADGLDVSALPNHLAVVLYLTHPNNRGRTLRVLADG
jgi:beta-ribofuranosylaminobenzene 5'-phosphate synthase